jgi:rod shape determining protein RodA
MRSIQIEEEGNIFKRFLKLSWSLVALLTILAGIGLIALYSAAGGSWSPWASRQFMHFCIGMVFMLVIAMVNIRWWYRLAWPCYFVGIVLLIIVEVAGHVGMGAQRWINLGFMNLQPSEIMKIAVIMVLARYYHIKGVEYVRQWRSLIVPGIVVALPMGLVLLQPDLGTALMLTMGAVAMIFMAGAPFWWFMMAGGIAVCAVPLYWTFFMHDYQKRRVLTFLNPESDPLGAGYHIAQSKIALGSGGFSGKGFLEGSQSRLNFLPEKQTDFIFTLWAEEWGFIGGVLLLFLFGLIFLYGIWIASQCRHNFGRFLALGLTVNFSLYVFINIAMVMGLIPVVGKALAMVSYGGTAMLAAMIGFGLILSCHAYRDSKLRSGF